MNTAQLEREYDRKFSQWLAHQLPTEAELDGYRVRWHQLCDNLRIAGLKCSPPNLTTERKVLVFMLKVTGAENAPELTKAQWDDFFVRIEAIKATEVGMIGLATLVNRANGLDVDGQTTYVPLKPVRLR